MYSVIYDAINAVKDALDGMHEPELKEEIIGNVRLERFLKYLKLVLLLVVMSLTGKLKEILKLD